MLSSLLFALTPVVLGAALAFLPGASRSLGPLRWVALIAAGVVVFVEMLPEAWEVLGVPSLALFLAGLLVPAGLERLAMRVSVQRGEGVGLELAGVGLSLHQLADGLQVGAAGVSEVGGPGLVLAIAAHTAPLIAVAVLGFVEHSGRGGALFRAGLLALATAVGVAVGHSGAAELSETMTACLEAGLAGLLLHVLTHQRPHGHGDAGETA